MCNARRSIGVRKRGAQLTARTLSQNNNGAVGTMQGLAQKSKPTIGNDNMSRLLESRTAFLHDEIMDLVRSGIATPEEPALFLIRTGTTILAQQGDMRDLMVQATVLNAVRETRIGLRANQGRRS
jgi:hypothetical protein